jgi:hypothetical protein
VQRLLHFGRVAHQDDLEVVQVDLRRPVEEELAHARRHFPTGDCKVSRPKNAAAGFRRIASFGARCMCDRPLRGDEFTATCVSEGSACAGQACDLDAGKLTLKLRWRIADVHARQWSTHSEPVRSFVCEA